MGEWHSSPDLHNSQVPSPKAESWLTTQSCDTFKALLQWVAMELI
jgi:hypothetical protein